MILALSSHESRPAAGAIAWPWRGTDGIAMIPEGKGWKKDEEEEVVEEEEAEGPSGEVC